MAAESSIWLQWVDALPGPGALLIILLAFILGGLIKGTLGVGLPLLAVPLMSLVIPAPTAIALMAVPVLMSNVWQAIDSGSARAHALRFTPLLITVLISTLITVPLALSLSLKALNVLVASAVLIAVFLMAFQPKVALSPRQERWGSPIVGALAGIMGGISSMAGPLIISYLLALKLPREVFIGSISVIYLFAMVPLYASLAWHGRLGWFEAGVSLVGLIPMFMGMRLGKSLRHRLSEVAFRRVLFWFLGMLALMLMFK